MFLFASDGVMMNGSFIGCVFVLVCASVCVLC